MKHANTIFAMVEFAETSRITPISMEAMNAARKLADRCNCGLAVIVMGSNNRHANEELQGYKLDSIYSLENSCFEHYQPEIWTSILDQFFGESKPKALVLGHTLEAIDLAPRLAFRLGADLINDCVAIDFESDKVVCTKPVFSSNILAKYVPTSEPYILTVRSKSFSKIPQCDSVQPEIIQLGDQYEIPEPAIKFIERVTDADGAGPDLENADIVVAGGRGMGGPEGFEVLGGLANTLNAALGSSRPPVDLGWISSKSQIGQTGAIIKPSLYIAVGISGASQHVAGVADSKTIIAINENPDANIFRIADFGIVGEFEEVVPALDQAIAEIVA